MRSLVLGLAAAAVLVPTAASAQSRHDVRQYNREVRAIQRDCARDLRNADSRREYRYEQRDCRKDLREARREFRRDVREDRRDRRRYWRDVRW